MKVIRRHRLLERFLAETLTMSWDEVHEEAEHMEHAASERLIDRIDAYLGHPTVDPHGDPIPRADGSLAETEGIPLARCQSGQHFRVARVMDQDPAFLRYLSECGLELHATGELLENRPEAGALVCRLGGRSVALGLPAAAKVLVIPTEHRDSASRAKHKS
jgi:DtxR family Mn-dependent transcriptional regulator